MDEKVLVKVEAAGNEIIIRTGEALELKQPEQIEVKGQIKAPTDFYLKRKHLFVKKAGDKVLEPNGIETPFKYAFDTSYLTIDKVNGKVKLVIDENNYFGPVIVGELTPNPVLKDLAINVENTVLEPKNLARKLRKYRHLASEPLKFDEVLRQLMNFKAVFQTEIEQTNDKKGTVAESIIRKLTSEHKLDFSIILPLFYETPLVTLDIVVEIDYKESTLVCGLYCPDYETTIEKVKEDTFADIQTTFTDIAILVI